MTSRYGRLDRLISKHLQISRSQVQRMLADARVQLNGTAARHADARVGPFDDIQVDGHWLQKGQSPIYLMLNKPAGVLSATVDARHRTVIDLVRQSAFASCADSLHLAGRLDATSTGLVLLTNDGDWSRALCDPQAGVRKCYHVRTRHPLRERDVAAFADGMYFATEDLVTRPATLRIIAEREARVILCEGRYHQIRRMFARCDNRVEALHRLSVGPWTLPADLAPGQCRAISG